MKKLPITNINKFKKRPWTTPWESNCEVFLSRANGCWHYQRKNRLLEGIKINWEGNPFNINVVNEYVLEK